MTTTDAIEPGLCGSCLHARRLVTRRGSVFYQCRLARTDASFRQYPALPVRHCRGYEPGEPDGTTETASRTTPTA